MVNQQQKRPSVGHKNPQAKPARAPNEQGSIVVQAHVKIFDPQSKKVYVEGRA